MPRNGKIARLPRAVREELNRRMDDGEQGEPLLRWLNELPATQKVVAAHFEGAAVNKQNLSDWRLGGFVEWQARQELTEDSLDLGGDVEDLAAARSGAHKNLTENLATVVGLRYARLVMDWKGEPDEAFEKKAKALRGMVRDVTELRRSDLRAAKQALDEKWRDHQRVKDAGEVLEIFDRWNQIDEVREIYGQSWPSEEERLRAVRRKYNMPEDRPDKTQWVIMAEEAARLAGREKEFDWRKEHDHKAAAERAAAERAAAERAAAEDGESENGETPNSRSSAFQQHSTPNAGGGALAGQGPAVPEERPESGSVKAGQGSCGKKAIDEDEDEDEDEKGGEDQEKAKGGERAGQTPAVPEGQNAPVVKPRRRWPLATAPTWEEAIDFLHKESGESYWVV